MRAFGRLAIALLGALTIWSCATGTGGPIAPSGPEEALVLGRGVGSRAVASAGGMAASVSKPWQQSGDYQSEDGLLVQEYMPEGEDLEQWSRMLTIQSRPVADGGVDAPSASMQRLRNNLQFKCPHADWRVIREEPGSVLYEWQVQDCPAREDQIAMGRIVRGSVNQWYVSYARRGRNLPPRERQSWLDWMSQVRVEMR